MRACVHVLVLLKAHLGEPFIEIQIFQIALLFEKPALEHPNRHLEKNQDRQSQNHKNTANFGSVKSHKQRRIGSLLDS